MAPSSNQPPEDDPGRRQRKRRRRRAILFSLVGIVVIILIIIAFLPTIISTAGGTKWILSLVNQPGGLTVHAKSLSLSWWAGQSADGLKINLPKRGMVVHVDHLSAPDVALFPVLLGSRDFGTVTADAVKIQHNTTATQPAGRPSPPSPQPAPHPSTTPTIPKNLSVKFIAKKIDYRAPGVSPITLTGVKLAIDTSNLDHISLAASGDIDQAGRKGSVNAKATLDQAFDASGQWQLNQARIAAAGTLVNLPTALVDGLMNQHGKLTAAIGPDLNATVHAKGPVQQLSAQLKAQSAYLNADVALTQKNKALVATPGSHVTWTLTPAAMTKFTEAGRQSSNGTSPATQTRGTQAASRAMLLKPITMNLTLNQLTLPHGPDGQIDFGQSSIQAGLTLSDVFLQTPSQGNVTLRHTRVQLQSSQLSHLITGKLTATAQIDNITKPVQAQFSVKNALSATGNGARGSGSGIQLDTSVSALPVVLLDAATGQGGRLTQTIGPTVTASLQMARQANQQIDFTAEAKAAQLDAQVGGTYDSADRWVQLRTKSPATLTLTPQSFADWLTWASQTQAASGQARTDQSKPPRLALTSPTTIKLNIPKMQLAMQPSGHLDPGGTYITADLLLPHMALEDTAAHRSIDIQGGQVSIQAANLNQVVKLLAQLKVATPSQAATTPSDEKTVAPGVGPGAGPGVGPGLPGHDGAIPSGQARAYQGSINSQTQITNLVNSDGRIGLAWASIQSQNQITDLPSVLIDAVAGGGGKVADVLGPSTSANAQFNIQPNRPGSAAITLQSDNIQGQIAAKLTPDQIIHLTKDAQFHIQVTPTITRSLLASINPMLGSVEASTVPMTLTIASQGFSVPATTFDWSKVNAQANLRAGDLVLTPTGLAGQILGVLGQLKVVPQQQTYRITLSPVDMKVERGLLSYNKLTIGVQDVDLNFTGNVNLATKALALNFSLSGKKIGSDLARVTVPIGGTIDHPKIDLNDLLQAAVKQGALHGLEKLGGKDLRKFLNQLLDKNKPKKKSK